MPNALVCGHGTGWVPEFPDLRDFTFHSEPVRALLGRSRLGLGRRNKLPAAADLRRWCPSIEDQGTIGSCTAHAAVGLVEYYERRAFRRHLDASRLFEYKVTRNLLHWTGDSGAFMRTALKALVLFGVPPEEFWPYEPRKLDREPPAFCYSFAQSYRAIQYVRLDPTGGDGAGLVVRLKRSLHEGIPFAFGFTVYSSIAEAETTGDIPLPEKGESVEGGHAVMAVGYDDAHRIGKQKGAFRIRNSWSKSWGEKGYGWIPYAYLEAGLADDFWTLLKQEWVDSGAFE